MKHGLDEQNDRGSEQMKDEGNTCWPTFGKASLSSPGGTGEEAG